MSPAYVMKGSHFVDTPSQQIPYTFGDKTGMTLKYSEVAIYR